MNTNIVKGTILCGLVIMTGCNRSENTNTISISDAIDVTFDDIATDIRITPLEADCPLDEVDVVQMYGNNLFIHSYNNSKIYLFTNNRLVATLDSKGRGHGEYSNIHRFDYSPENKMLYITTGNDKSVLWYDVPSMKFQGQTELTDFPQFLKLVNNETFITDQNCNLCSVEISTGQETEILELSKVANNKCQSTFESYNSNNRAFSICDEYNILYSYDEEHGLTKLDEISFGDDGFPKKYLDLYNESDLKEKDLDKLIEAKMYQFTEHYLDCIILTRLLDNGYEFWYCNMNAPEGDKDYYRLYRNQNGKVTNLKGFCIPGIKDQILPDGFENGCYYLVLSGPSEALADPDEEPSELAKRIFKAVDSQPDFNPVIMTWKM